MKKNAVLFIVLSPSLLFATFVYKITTDVGFAFATTTISMNPSAISASVGQNFTIDINISDVYDLYGWEFKLNWTATILEVTNVVEGSFLKKGGSTFFTFKKNNTEGYIIVDCTLLGGIPGVSGDGILATVEFYVEAVGESPLDFNNTMLINSFEQPIFHQSADGYGYFTPPHDVAVVSISVSPVTTLPSQPIYINVTVENQGGYGENFNVTAYYNSEVIETQSVSLEQGQSTMLNFTWDTTGIGKGDYVISAEASEVPSEIDTTDNKKVADNTVTILTLGHDVAIKDVTSNSVVGQGYSLFINVTTKNYGSFTETFNVTTHCNGTAITQPDGKNYKTVTLTSGSSTIIIFTWNTSGFFKGDYTIWAYAWPVLDEADTINNNCTNGWILITKVGDFGGGLPPQFFICDGITDGKDLSLFLQCFRGIAPIEAMYLGDLGGGIPPQFYKCDGKVDGKDLSLFLLCFKGLGPDN